MGAGRHALTRTKRRITTSGASDIAPSSERRLPRELTRRPRLALVEKMRARYSRQRRTGGEARILDDTAKRGTVAGDVLTVLYTMSQFPDSVREPGA